MSIVQFVSFVYLGMRAKRRKGRKKSCPGFKSLTFVRAKLMTTPLYLSRAWARDFLQHAHFHTLEETVN